MQCPKCGSKTTVLNTIHKKEFTTRYRRCVNKKCRHRFSTKEEYSSGWHYKSIVKQIKDIVKNVNV